MYQLLLLFNNIQSFLSCLEHAGGGIIRGMAWNPYCLHFDNCGFHKLLPAVPYIWQTPHHQDLPREGGNAAENGGSMVVIFL